MGFIDVFVTLSAIAGYCIYRIQRDGSDDSSDSNLQWDLVSSLHISESNSLFLTSSALLVFRRLALYTVIASVLSIVLDPAGMTATVSTRDGSQKSVHLTHLSRLTTFTVWSWMLIGLFFGLTLFVTHHKEGEVPLWVLRLTWVLYEVSFSVSLLITVVVTFVLIPGAKLRGLPTANFYKVPALLMHNANVIFMIFENVNNRLPFHFPHVVFGVLYGIFYTVFAWVWYEYAGIFYYFFLDYGRPFAVACHLGLILALVTFFYVGVLLSQLVEMQNPYVYLVLGLILPMILKFRD